MEAEILTVVISEVTTKREGKPPRRSMSAMRVFKGALLRPEHQLSWSPLHLTTMKLALFSAALLVLAAIAFAEPEPEADPWGGYGGFRGGYGGFRGGGFRGGYGGGYGYGRKKRSADPEPIAEASPEPEAAPWGGYGGFRGGYGGFRGGYGGFRGGFGGGYGYGRKKRSADPEPAAEASPEPEAAPWGGYGGFRVGHGGFRGGFGGFRGGYGGGYGYGR